MSVVRSWYENHSDVKILNWPSVNVDINPLHKIWNHISRKLEYEYFSDQYVLQQKIFDCWEDFRTDDGYFEDIIGGLKRRLQELVENDGGFVDR